MATIKVRGQGSVPTRADEALLSFEVASVAETAAEAFAAASEEAVALSKLLDEAGVDSAARSTTGIAVHEVEDFDGQTPVRRRHRAATAVNVRVSDPDDIAQILRAAVDRSDASVRGPLWRAANTEEAQQEACRAAVDDAKRRAAAYAERLDARVGPVIAVDDSLEGHPVVPLPVRAVAAASALPIYPDELAVSAAVDVTFELVSP